MSAKIIGRLGDSSPFAMNHERWPVRGFYPYETDTLCRYRILTIDIYKDRSMYRWWFYIYIYTIYTILILWYTMQYILWFPDWTDQTPRTLIQERWRGLGEHQPLGFSMGRPKGPNEIHGHFMGKRGILSSKMSLKGLGHLMSPEFFKTADWIVMLPLKMGELLQRLQLFYSTRLWRCLEDEFQLCCDQKSRWVLDPRCIWSLHWILQAVPWSHYVALCRVSLGHPPHCLSRSGGVSFFKKSDIIGWWDDEYFYDPDLPFLLHYFSQDFLKDPGGEWW